MLKYLMITWLCLLSLAGHATEGFKLGADGTKFFTYWGGKALYQEEKNSIECTVSKKIKSVDQYGDAYTGVGFNCGKDLFLFVKKYLDVNLVLLIVVDPAKFEERKAYRADMFLEYDDKEK